MCAMTLTSHGWDLRNIAKNDQGTAHCELFPFLFESGRNGSTEIFSSHFILYGEPTCAMTIIS